MKYNIIFCGEKLDINNGTRIWGIMSLYDIDECDYEYHKGNYVFFGTPKTLIIKKVWNTYRRIAEKKRFYQKIDDYYIFEKFPEIKINIEQFLLIEMLK